MDDLIVQQNLCLMGDKRAELFTLVAINKRAQLEIGVASGAASEHLPKVLCDANFPADNG